MRILLLGLLLVVPIGAMESDLGIKAFSPPIQYPARWAESRCSRSKVPRDPGNPVIPDAFRRRVIRDDHQGSDTANRPSVWKSLISFGSEMVEIGKALIRRENLSD